MRPIVSTRSSSGGPGGRSFLIRVKTPCPRVLCPSAPPLCGAAATFGVAVVVGAFLVCLIRRKISGMLMATEAMVDTAMQRLERCPGTVGEMLRIRMQMKWSMFEGFPLGVRFPKCPAENSTPVIELRG